MHWVAGFFHTWNIPSVVVGVTAFVWDAETCNDWGQFRAQSLILAYDPVGC